MSAVSKAVFLKNEVIILEIIPSKCKKRWLEAVLQPFCSVWMLINNKVDPTCLQWCSQHDVVVKGLLIRSQTYWVSQQIWDQVDKMLVRAYSEDVCS